MPIGNQDGDAVLRDFEKTAVYTLLVRQLEAEDAQAKAEVELARAKETLTEAKAARAAITNALKMFGFDMSVQKPWNYVKEEIGKELWEQAFSLVRPKIHLPIPIEPPADEPNEEDELEKEESLDLSSSNDGGGKIRKLVLDKLISSGAEGIKASIIKDEIISQGIEMHDKTVGMTLYRLSKDGLAKRDGRIWYFVSGVQQKEPPDDESEQEASEGSVD